MEIYTAQTVVLPVYEPTIEPFQRAAAVIRAGGLVAFPTETVYGLGANALDAQAVARIFSAKQRPLSDPVIVHIAEIGQLAQVAINIPPAAYALAERFWAGALTLVLERAPHLPDNLATGLKTVAVRMPAHPVAQQLILQAGVPIAAPSANTFTRPSATRAEHVLEDLNGHVDIILDGGDTPIGIESTVIDMTQHPPVILRPGGIVLDALREIITEIQLMPRYIEENPENTPQSPGMLLKHYSPRAELLLFDGDRSNVLHAMRAAALDYRAENKRVGILTTNEEADHFTDTGARIISMGSRSDLDKIAQMLFGAMRALDKQNVDKILVAGTSKEGLGAAIWDRLLRAAEGKVRQA